ncbi:MAG: hypothetical protein K6E63_08655 [Lachnospiraceae bacterium]|nr:hypothetical protein [Lachnospiraceae bacterium]
MKDIKTGTLCASISMISVFIMFVWGYLANDFGHSWLAVMAGGIISCIVSMVRKDKDKAEEDNKES